MKRDDFNQLPSSSELENILGVEAKRDLPKEKENIHYFNIEPLIKLTDYFDINNKIFLSNYSKNDILRDGLLEEGKSVIENLKTKILNKDLSREDIENLNSTYDYLAEEDTPEKSDLIFIFGSKTPLRIEKAIELYNQSFSEKLVVSGHGPNYGESSGQTEAEIYTRIAQERGVPESSIIIENKSITIPDNVRTSLNLLDKSKISYSSLILVNSPYCQRRGWVHFKKYLPDSVKVIRVNCETGDKYKREFWYKNSEGINVIIGEYIKMKVAVSLNTA